jgi:hypothetical protein
VSVDAYRRDWSLRSLECRVPLAADGSRKAVALKSSIFRIPEARAYCGFVSVV